MRFQHPVKGSLRVLEHRLRAMGTIPLAHKEKFPVPSKMNRELNLVKDLVFLFAIGIYICSRSDTFSPSIKTVVT